MSLPEKVHWTIDSKHDHSYEITTWYRSVGIEKFVKKIEDDGYTIAGITFAGNNIGFIIDKHDE